MEGLSSIIPKPEIVRKGSTDVTLISHINIYKHTNLNQVKKKWKNICNIYHRLSSAFF